MRANDIEVFTESLPYLLPDESNTVHVEISDLNKSLQRKLPRVFLICKKLFLADLAKACDKINDSIGVKLSATLNYQVNFVHINTMHNES